MASASLANMTECLRAIVAIYRVRAARMAAVARAAMAVAGGQKFSLAVCGLHLRGQPLNSQLTNLQSTFVSSCQSAPEYK